MISLKIIEKERKDDINICNQPFKSYGRLLPSYRDGKWSYGTELFDENNIVEACFPNENYDYEKLSKNSVFIGAYDGDDCIGLAILQKAPFKYMYLYDLKVNNEYRRKGIGKKLIEKAKEIALNLNYNGLYTQGQDNNLGACLFYLKNGFVIGGLDTEVYKGTPQQDKKDVIFYCDAL